MNLLKRALSITLLTLFSTTAFAAGSIFVYSGAGLKKPMEEIATIFEKEHDTTVEFNFAGSGQLLAQLETTRKGDAFIVGSDATYLVAHQKGLVGEAYAIAHHTPAIVVLKGNPKGIEVLEDLAKPGMKLILGDAKANAIGKTAQNILKKNQLEKINENVVSTANTINEMVMQMALGNADATIATVDAVFMNDNVEVIMIDPAQNIDQIVTGAVVTSSKEPQLAKAFMDLAASEEGKEIFAKYGFAPVNEAPVEEMPVDEAPVELIIELNQP
ncbi:ABC transporter substrate-binding protein [Ignatzschineria indica]|uniref:Molybdate ABC transporter substrate-binding protein n=1 Tax=Ignatzschineria indica TaxID=472583 RepID=A0A2U2AIA5_9GAMM|nr:molybdate ABC transporter substrate-binding protein [Ignatzschineria indica]PWD82392.1 molybdate ABC transporter substrate-binding protein [Ignatzschineria indica]GGZ86786.1 ABC transporter substrate-binding protein [Ignatzschineria indica]